MQTVRRRVLRPAPTHPISHQRTTKLRQTLDTERTSLNRWMARLKRAFHAVEKIQAKVNRLERQLRNLENQ